LNGIPTLIFDSDSSQSRISLQQARYHFMERFLFVYVVYSMILFTTIPAVPKRGRSAFPTAPEVESLM